MEKMDKMEKDIQDLSKTIKDSTDSITTSVIKILDRKNDVERKKDKNFMIIIILLIFSLVLSWGSFLYYIMNYEYVETFTDQEGVYNMIDSEGNVISSDKEEIEEFLKWQESEEKQDNE